MIPKLTGTQPFLPTYEDLVCEGVIERRSDTLPDYESALEYKQSLKTTIAHENIPVSVGPDGSVIFSLRSFNLPPVTTLHQLNELQIPSPTDNFRMEGLLGKEELFVPYFHDSGINLAKERHSDGPENTDNDKSSEVKNTSQQLASNNEDTIIHNVPSNDIDAQKRKKPNENKKEKLDEEEDIESSKTSKCRKSFRYRVGNFIKDAKDLLDTRLATPMQSTQIHIYKPGNSPKVETKTLITDEELYHVGEECLRLTNEFREKNNLAGDLQWSEELYFLGCQHSLDMCEKKVPFGHQGFEDRVSNFPFTSYRSAENVFMSKGIRKDKAAKTAIDGWINSPGHCANLLGNFNTCAIGVCQSSGEYYFTQLFAQQ